MPELKSHTTASRAGVPSYSTTIASLLGLPEAETEPDAADGALEPAPARGHEKLSPARRANLWQPGQSGNPGGRKKVSPEIRKVFEAATIDAAELLCGILRDPSCDVKLRVHAAELILDRVFGKSAQPIDAALGAPEGPVVFEFRGVLDEWAK